MKKLLLITLFSFIAVSMAFGQGIVRGKITDDKGETLIGVSIALKSNRSIGTMTDFDGNYELKISDSTAQIIIITYVGYTIVEETVHPMKGGVVIRDVVMTSSAQALKGVDISEKAVKNRDYYVENVKKNSATTIDYISSESMKKTGDNNVNAAIARVSGVSTNGAFITVRGIGDRYVKTTVNGSRIPTLDPFTNNIKLDLIPANLVDNVIITKTASPDLPGDWAGGYISVETKDYPEQLAVNAETSIGYNSQSTFNDVITSQTSKTDWMGFDNSLRDHDHSTFVATVKEPNQYQQLVALGLGDYFNSLGVTEDNWSEGTSRGDTYFKLGLVQLGLLPPALINDESAFQAAKNQYDNGSYQSDAFQIVNANVTNSGQSFPANWNTSTKQAPLNFSQTFSIGNQTSLFGKQLGYIAGFRYGNSMQYDAKSTANRASVVGGDNGELINTTSSRLTQQSSMEGNGWSALFNVALKLNPNNNVSLMFMPNYLGVNKVRKSLDQTDKTVVATLSQFYEQRKQLVYQIETDHYLPAQKTKIEFSASYTNGTSTAPDFKNVQYWINPDSTYQIGGTIGDGIHRYYRYLTDNLLDSRISAEFPISSIPDLPRKIKFGGAYLQNDKTSDQYDYAVDLTSDLTPLMNEDIDAYLNLNQFGIVTETNSNGIPISYIPAFYTEGSTPADHNFGKTKIAAGFISADYSITRALRVSGGVRVEKAYIYTDAVIYDSLGLAYNDPRRVYDNAKPLMNPGKIDEVNYLPSINVIYKLGQDEQAPLNIRANFSQTIARPSIRELSDVEALDYELRAPVFGNSSLKTVQINNYDLRLEKYFKSNNNVSVSLFYKDFKNHIELVKSGGYTWQNVDKSYCYGIELEGRKAITRKLMFSSNVTFVYSNTSFVRQRMEISNGEKIYIPQDTVSRTMFGQAPYLINAILSYSMDSIGLIMTLSYNIQGPRLVIAADVKEIPDIYELPRNLLDFKVSKKLGKHFLTSLTIKDILNTSTIRAYKYPEGFNTLNYDKFTYGTYFIFSLAYKL